MNNYGKKIFEFTAWIRSLFYFINFFFSFLFSTTNSSTAGSTSVSTPLTPPTMPVVSGVKRRASEEASGVPVVKKFLLA